MLLTMLFFENNFIHVVSFSSTVLIQMEPMNIGFTISNWNMLVLALELWSVDVLGPLPQPPLDLWSVSAILHAEQSFISSFNSRWMVVATTSTHSPSSLSPFKRGIPPTALIVCLTSSSLALLRFIVNCATLASSSASVMLD